MYPNRIQKGTLLWLKQLFMYFSYSYLLWFYSPSWRPNKHFVNLQFKKMFRSSLHYLNTEPTFRFESKNPTSDLKQISSSSPRCFNI